MGCISNRIVTFQTIFPPFSMGFFSAFPETPEIGKLPSNLPSPKFLPELRAKVKGKTWEAHQEKALGSETQFRFVKWKWWVPALVFWRWCQIDIGEVATQKKQRLFFSRFPFFVQKATGWSWKGKHAKCVSFLFRLLWCHISKNPAPPRPAPLQPGSQQS